ASAMAGAANRRAAPAATPPAIAPVALSAIRQIWPTNLEKVMEMSVVMEEVEMQAEAPRPIDWNSSSEMDLECHDISQGYRDFSSQTVVVQSPMCLKDEHVSGKIITDERKFQCMDVYFMEYQRFFF
ncbi:glycosyl hydrolase family 25, partial [Striga asiatica]